jgi:phosphoglycerate dehydrogenase-like enzyme
MQAVFFGTYPARELKRVEKALTSTWRFTQIFDDELTSPRAVASLADADALVTSVYGRSHPPAPRIRLLQSTSAGVDRIDQASIPPGCTLTNLYGHEIAIAEYVLASMLDWAMRYRERAATFLADGQWSDSNWFNDTNVHGELHAKTVGIFGFGRIGREVARRAKAFGMRVVALSTWSNAEPADDALIDRRFTISQVAEFLREVDYLAATAPLVEETRGIIDASWFAHMKAAAVLIHVGRGPVIDEAALFGALSEKRIRGASIDVWYSYPKADGIRVPPASFPFHTLPNIVMTPHSSSRSNEAIDRRFADVAANLDALARGKALRNVVAVKA